MPLHPTHITAMLCRTWEKTHPITNLFPFTCSSQASFDLPTATKFDPYTPRISLDSIKVTATQAFTAALKEHLTEILTQPVEARLLTLQPSECAGTFEVGDFTFGGIWWKYNEANHITEFNTDIVASGEFKSIKSIFIDAVLWWWTNCLKLVYIIISLV